MNGCYSGFGQSVTNIEDCSQLFALGQMHLNGIGANELILSDIDNDNDLDLITNDEQYSVNIWLNDGTGQYTLISSLPIEYLVLDITVGDVNGDGYADILMPELINGLQIWLGLGDGQFNLSSTLPMQDHIRLGDIDSDGDIDMVTSASFSTTHGDLLLNDGTGQFTSTETEVNAHELSLQDMNQDTHLDAVYIDPATDQLLIVINDGNGHFVDTQYIAQHIHHYALGDIDQQLGSDIVIETTNEQQITLFNNGTGQFTESCPLTLNEATAEAALKDMDNDGDLDLVKLQRTSYGGIEIWLYNDNGCFIQTKQVINSRDSGWAVGDIDDDGYTDIVASFNNDSPYYFTWHNTGISPIFSPNLDITHSITQVCSVGETAYLVATDKKTDEEYLWFNETQTEIVQTGAIFEPVINKKTTFYLAVRNIHTDCVSERIPVMVTFTTQFDLSETYCTTMTDENGNEVKKKFVYVTIRGTEGEYVLTNHGVGQLTVDTVVNVETFVVYDLPEQDTVLNIMVAQQDGQACTVVLQDRIEACRYNNSPTACGTPSLFGAQQNQLEMTNLKQLRIADVDGDQDNDILIAGSVGLGVWKNDGLGQFTTSTFLFANIDKFVTADIDLDGDEDVLTLSSYSMTWFANDGQGMFMETGITLSQPTMNTWHLADWENDGDVDIFTISNFNYINTIWLNDGTGHFTAQALSGSNNSAVSVGDVNQDGYVDAVFRGGTTRVEVWLNDGNGDIQKSTLQDDLISGNPNLVDINSDGVLELMIDHTIWRNNGQGYFTYTGERIGEEASNFQFIDIDNDSDLDALGSSVYLNKNNIEYESLGQYIGSSGPFGDLNGDGYVDFISINNDKATVFLNRANLSLLQPTLVHDAIINDACYEDTLYLEVVAKANEEYLWYNERQSELLHIGSTFHPVITENTIYYVAARSTITGCTTEFVPVAVQLQTDVQQFGPYCNEQTQPQFMEFRVIGGSDTYQIGNHGSGILSHTVVNNNELFRLYDLYTDEYWELSVIPSQQTDCVEHLSGQVEDCWGNNNSYNCTTLFRKMPSPVSTFEFNANHMAVGDIDNDGDDDIVAQAIWLNNGQGVFTPHSRLPKFGQHHGSVTLADVNNDGYLDAALQISNSGVEIWLNNQDLTFSYQTIKETIAHGARKMAFADLDGDNDLDLGVATLNWETEIWWNDGTGQFTDSGQRLEGIRSTSLVWTDFNGDNAPDLFGRSDNDEGILWLNDGTGQFSSTTIMANLEFISSVNTTDLDKDGDMDLVVCGNASTALWLNNGDASFTQSTQAFSGMTTNNVTFLDLNQDEQLDLLFRYNGSIYAWWNDGQTNFTLYEQVLSNVTSLYLTDLEQDQDMDAIMLSGEYGNEIEVWQNDYNISGTSTALIDTTNSITTGCRGDTALLIGLNTRPDETYRWLAADSTTVVAINNIFQPIIQEDTHYYATLINEQTGCEGTTLKIPVTLSTEPVAVNVKVFLQGCYDETMGEMKTPLNTNAHLPLHQSYTEAPYFYEGIESVAAIPTPDIVDWVLIEVRENLTGPIVEQQAAFIHKNGQIVDLTGLQVPIFQRLNPKLTYWIVIRHRNHLDVVSSEALSMTNNELTYDFTTQQSLGVAQMAEVVPNTYALYAGDMTGEGIISVSDFNLFMDEIKQTPIPHYWWSDVNLDGVVTVDDFNQYQQNASIIGVHYIRYE